MARSGLFLPPLPSPTLPNDYTSQGLQWSTLHDPSRLVRVVFARPPKDEV